MTNLVAPTKCTHCGCRQDQHAGLYGACSIACPISCMSFGIPSEPPACTTCGHSQEEHVELTEYTNENYGCRILTCRCTVFTDECKAPRVDVDFAKDNCIGCNHPWTDHRWDGDSFEWCKHQVMDHDNVYVPCSCHYYEGSKIGREIPVLVDELNGKSVTETLDWRITETIGKSYVNPKAIEKIQLD